MRRGRHPSQHDLGTPDEIVLTNNSCCSCAATQEITNNTLCNASCAQVRQSCVYTRTLILPYAPMKQENRKLAFGLNGVSSVSITGLYNYLMITIKSSSVFGALFFYKIKNCNIKSVIIEIFIISPTA